MSDKKTWLEMSNGQRLAAIPFVAWVNAGDGLERRFEFEAPNPPIYAGDANLFSRLSFEAIKARFEAWGFGVDHIIRGECSESGVRDCYVYRAVSRLELTGIPYRMSRVPFAVIRPKVFA